MVKKMLKIEPNSRKYDEKCVFFVDLDKFSIKNLKICHYLSEEPLDWDELFSKLILEEVDPKDEKFRQKVYDRINEKCGSMIVEMLNYVQQSIGKEISEDSVFQIVSE